MKLLLACAVMLGPVAEAQAAPLALYTAPEQTPIAPIAPAAPCGDFTVACGGGPASAAAVPGPRKTALPFDYGLAVSGTVIGSNHGSYGGVGVSGWVAAKDLPLTLYFDYQQLQPLGGRR